MKILLGNGNLLVYVDRFSQLKDFYFPFAGQENHLGKREHKIGVWCEGKISWLGEDWQTEINYKKDTLVGRIIAKNDVLGIELEINDVVHYKNDIYIRKIVVKNLRDEKREIRLFLSQYFNIYETDTGNTAYFNPKKNAIIYYKNNRYFLISSSKVFDDYAIGKFNVYGMKGTYIDAEDGELSKNAIDHGTVDSVISFHLPLEKKSEAVVYYWIAAGKKHGEILELNDHVLKNKPENLMAETEAYWKNWVSRIKLDIDEDILNMVKRSLMIIRVHADNRGGILASTDSEILKFYRDSYNYIWPRDAAFAAIALDDAGYSDLSRNFFIFCNKTITDEGYFLPKYNPNYSVGSSWHPWIKYGKLRLPIQEDETALVLHALWKHYEKTQDIMFIKSIYKKLITKAAEFLVNFREKNLTKESYDLWEEKFGSHAFTACTVYAGLVAAANFAKLLKRVYEYKKFSDAAEEIKQGIKSDFYDERNSMFFRRIKNRDFEILKETKIDSSTGYALHEFVFDANDEILTKEMNTIKERLTCKTDVGGLARYEEDGYYRVSKDTPGNPWFICTLWLAQYYIKIAKKLSDLEEAKKILKWTVKYASSTGLLSEQLNPLTGEQVSVSPLTWSHSTFVETVFRYAKKAETMKNTR